MQRDSQQRVLHALRRPHFLPAASQSRACAPTRWQHDGSTMAVCCGSFLVVPCGSAAVVFCCWCVPHSLAAVSGKAEVNKGVSLCDKCVCVCRLCVTCVVCEVVAVVPATAQKDGQALAMGFYIPRHFPQRKQHVSGGHAPKPSLHSIFRLSCCL